MVGAVGARPSNSLTDLILSIEFLGCTAGLNWKCQWSCLHIFWPCLMDFCQICSLNIIFHWLKIGFASRKLFFSQMICFAWQTQESKQSRQSSPDNFTIFASGFFPFFFFGSVSGQMSRAVMLLGRNQSKSKWYWWAHTTHASRSVSYLEPCVSYRVFDIIFFLSPWGVSQRYCTDTPPNAPHMSILSRVQTWIISSFYI